MATNQLPFIHRASLIREKVTLNTPFYISLSGSWPNPSWTHTHTNVQTNLERQEITILYLGERKKGIALQVLEPFQDKIRLSLQSEGEWTLIIQGRSSSINLTIKCE